MQPTFFILFEVCVIREADLADLSVQIFKAEADGFQPVFNDSACVSESLAALAKVTAISSACKRLLTATEKVCGAKREPARFHQYFQLEDGTKRLCETDDAQLITLLQKALPAVFETADVENSTFEDCSDTRNVTVLKTLLADVTQHLNELAETPLAKKAKFISLVTKELQQSAILDALLKAGFEPSLQSLQTYLPAPQNASAKRL